MIASIVPMMGIITVKVPNGIYASLCFSLQTELMVVTTYPPCGNESREPNAIAIVRCNVPLYLHPSRYNAVQVRALESFVPLMLNLLNQQ